LAEQRRNFALADRGVQLVHALLARQVCLDSLNLRVAVAQRGRGVLDFGVVGGDDHVEPAGDALLGEFVADACRCAGNDGERAVADCHSGILPLVVWIRG
jgi:hypothetical protein